MLPTKQLFNAEEAFVRVGQLRETGCLVIIHAESTVRLFVENGAVVHACAESDDGMPALERALSFTEASHLWLPDAKPPQKPLSIDIVAFARKNSLPHDIHLARTSKVQDAAAAPLDRKRITEPLPGGPALTPYYLLEKGHSAKKLEIHKGTAIIGRNEACDIILADVQVSRRHCILQITPQGLRFRDLNSSNGIMVNGKPVKEGVLKVGDKLKVGTSLLEVYGESQPAG
jgi:type III secretion system (T3SS) inner membrane Yop/YscD-like protein